MSTELLSNLWDHMGPLAQLIGAVFLALNYLQSWKNGRGIVAVKNATDGMKDELVKVTGDAKYKEGVEHGEAYMKRQDHATSNEYAAGVQDALDQVKREQGF